MSVHRPVTTENPDERPEVPTARLSGRDARAAGPEGAEAAAAAAGARARPRAAGRAGPKTPNLMAAHEVCRCARCGNLLPLPVELASSAARSAASICTAACSACRSTPARAGSARRARSCRRASRRRTRATRCALFTPRTTIERQTGTPASSERRRSRPVQQRPPGVRRSVQVAVQPPAPSPA